MVVPACPCLYWVCSAAGWETNRGEEVHPLPAGDIHGSSVVLGCFSASSFACLLSARLSQWLAASGNVKKEPVREQKVKQGRAAVGRSCLCFMLAVSGGPGTAPALLYEV